MINVIGLGYIGLPTALALAAHGNKVTGTDINAGIVNKLNAGEVTFKEEGLQELYNEALKKGIEFSAGHKAADTYVVAVPTPYDKVSKKIDPGYIILAVDSVLAVCGKGAVIVIESTVSPGTIDRHIRPIISEKGFVTGKDIHIVHAPERITPPPTSMYGL